MSVLLLSTTFSATSQAVENVQAQRSENYFPQVSSDLALRSAKPFILTATLAGMIMGGLNCFATFRHRRAKPPFLRK